MQKKPLNLDETLCIVPFGVVKRDLVEMICAGITEQIPVKCHIMPPQSMPKQAYDPARKQYNSTLILDLIKDMDAPSQRILGITEFDLFCAKQNYVYGESDLMMGVGVISLHRLPQEYYKLIPDEKRFFKRAITEGVHATGHIFGLKHCSDHYCVMFNSPSLVDVDQKGFKFCSKCTGLLPL
jgi:archaemetzincin